MGRPKGRRIAVATAAVGSATLLLTHFLLRQRILEEWNNNLFKSGDQEAKLSALGWIGEYGGESSLVAVEAWRYERCPQFILHSRAEMGKDWDLMVEQATRRRLAFNLDPFINRSLVNIQTRLGESATVEIRIRLLTAPGISPRHLVGTARQAILSNYAVEIAVRRFPECFADPDPLVRAGAAYGLGDAGVRAGPGAIEALAALRCDPDEVVREAAEYAVRRLGEAGATKE